MVRIGIVGLGFMGKMHFEIFQTLAQRAKIVAIADVGRDRRSGEWSAVGGNMATRDDRPDLRDITAYDTPDALIADPSVEVVDITLPTHLHREYAVKALEAGKHVICEKPLAHNSAAADAMVRAAGSAKRLLLVGQCIRFWPAYVKAREIVLDRRYGRVVTACFRRFSTMPAWSWDNWLFDPERSGLAALDLHIHDADFVAHTFGSPESVSSFGGTLHAGGFDHIVTRYIYPDGKLVTAEGGWEYAPGFPFSMTFSIHMEGASLALSAGGELTLYPVGGVPEAVAVDSGTGYRHELAHFLDCLAANTESPVITAASARDSVRLIEAEIQSASTGKTVSLNPARGDVVKNNCEEQA